MHAANQVTGGILWANLHVLFSLSLTPFATAGMGENHFAPWPVTLYGVLLLFTGIAYFILTKALIAVHGAESLLAASIGSDRKGTASARFVLFHAAMRLNDLVKVEGPADLDVQLARCDLLDRISRPLCGLPASLQDGRAQRLHARLWN